MIRPKLPIVARWRSCSRTSSPRPAIGSSASSSGSARKIRSISSSIVAVNSESDSVLGCSAQNVVSLGSEPRIVCIVQLVEREVPAVAAAADEALQDPERRVHRLARVLVPAAERRDVLEAVLGQVAEQLQLRVDAGLEAAEHLQDQLF